MARASLDPGSFADLTCVSFTSARGSLAHVAVAYQISGQRRQRRDRLAHAVAGSGLLPLASRPIGETSGAPSSSSRSARPGPRAFSRSRSSALSLLTHSRDDSDADDDGRQGSVRSSATASAMAAAAAPPSASAATAATLQRVVAALEEQTFLSFYSGRDLSLLQQLTAPTAPAARSSLLSANVLLAHPDPHVGVMSGSVNGDIHVFAPVAYRHSERGAPDGGPVGGAAAAAAAEWPGHEQQRAASGFRQQSAAPLFGRHRLTPAMRAMLQLATPARALWLLHSCCVCLRKIFFHTHPCASRLFNIRRSSLMAPAAEAVRDGREASGPPKPVAARPRGQSDVWTAGRLCLCGSR